VHFEILGNDVAALRTFYSELFGGRSTRTTLAPRCRVAKATRWLNDEQRRARPSPATASA